MRGVRITITIIDPAVVIHPTNCRPCDQSEGAVVVDVVVVDEAGCSVVDVIDVVSDVEIIVVEVEKVEDVISTG